MTCLVFEKQQNMQYILWIEKIVHVFSNSKLKTKQEQISVRSCEKLETSFHFVKLKKLDDDLDDDFFENFDIFFEK